MPIQNAGKQASIFATVGRLRDRHGTLVRARQSVDWKKAVTDTAQLIDKMPLWRLQVLRKETLDFLYVKSPEKGNIRLKGGVAANPRRFHGMILRLAQSEWLHFIHRGEKQ